MRPREIWPDRWRWWSAPASDRKGRAGAPNMAEETAATPDFNPARVLSTDGVVDLVLVSARRPEVTFDNPVVPMSIGL